MHPNDRFNEILITNIEKYNGRLRKHKTEADKDHTRHCAFYFAGTIAINARHLIKCSYSEAKSHVNYYLLSINGLKYSPEDVERFVSKYYNEEGSCN